MALTISRRAALRGSLMGLATIATAGRAQLAMADADTDKRFVVVLLRGALDGMASVVPYGDPHLAALRAPLIPGQPGSADGVLDLGGFYGFHPALTGLHDMYKQGEVLPVHAIAGPYRSRSHFEAQDMLQTGADDDQNRLRMRFDERAKRTNRVRDALRRVQFRDHADPVAADSVRPERGAR
ncbi:MAG: hypothetical protein B7X01_03495, partial [Acidiphilium sp. 21-62-4]